MASGWFYLVCVVLGFMIAFSYNLTKEGEGAGKDKAWDQEYELRQKLIEQEKQNRELQKELLQKQENVSQIEKDLAQEKQLFSIWQRIRKNTVCFSGK